MESLGDILKRITVKHTSRITSGVGAGLPGDENTYELGVEPDGEICDHCNGSGWVSKLVPVGHPDFGEAFRCRCEELTGPDLRAAALRRYSNLGPLARINFDSTKPDGSLPDAGSHQLFKHALAAATEFAENPTGWLTFTGPSGSGKTHLAAAIANHCIEHGHTTFFIVLADFLDHLRSAYSPENPVSYDDLFEQVRDVPVLVLDDMGNHSATPWAQEKLFQVFNHRFNAALPTVITVRGPLQRLDEGLRSRLEAAEGFSKVVPLGKYNTRLARRIGDLPDEMRRRMTFENFDVRGGRNASRKDQESLHQAKQAAETFAAEPDGWLLFTGDRGSGKTHLAAAIAGVALDKSRSVFYAFVPSLLDHLRSTFSPDSTIGYDELFEQVQSTPLLILDDLGSESNTPWAAEKLYQIIVYRQEARFPTVITSVYPIEKLGEANPQIASRLLDSMVVDWEPITAPNYRDQRRERSSAPPPVPRPHRGDRAATTRN